MTPQEFVAKWERVKLSERSACQQHFLDLCELLGHPTPAAADPEGTSFTFERGCRKTGGAKGWADVWKRDFFGWEYKGRHKDLDEAYSQLCLYREALENPPLLVVCDMDRLEVHTNFTRKAARVYKFGLAGLPVPANLEILRNVFFNPDALSPDATREKITEEAADRVGELADGMRVRGILAQRAGHFLMKLVFCMFSERIGLLPTGLFSRLVEMNKVNPPSLAARLTALFSAMEKGGAFGEHEIAWFNGGLFADTDVVPPTTAEAATLAQICTYDWASVEPSIFGTLFERILDPDKRSQIGAHYTSREDIETLLVPVMLAPLRREWDEVKANCEGILPLAPLPPGEVPARGYPGVRADGAGVRAQGRGARAPRRSKTAMSKPSLPRKKLERALLDFAERLAHVTVLDPACGSGNFLYVALHMLLDLEKEVIGYGYSHGVPILGHVSPTQLHGLEINPYAQQLAQVAIWIGYLQWMHHNGFRMPDHPVLSPIESIRCADAILDLSDPEHPKEPEWPAAEFIVGNPPFLGNKRMRSALGARYASALWELFSGRIPATSDLCCYWLERARAAVTLHHGARAGLLATTASTQVGSRRALERIGESCKIFFAISDREWLLDGASVRVSMVGFGGKGAPEGVSLDGEAVPNINADLTSGRDATKQRRLKPNLGLCFMGVTKVGDFDIAHEIAVDLLSLPNPNGRPNSDVIRPFRNGSDLVRLCSGRWIIDYGVARPVADAAGYEAPFEYLTTHVKGPRSNNNREAYRERWWVHAESRPGFREAVSRERRYIGTARVAKHRLFVWLDAVILPDSKVIAIARSDDGGLGVLQSRAHEVWTLATCGWHGVGNDATYNPTLCYETFPFPEATPGQVAEIGAAAKGLDDPRSRWLNPPEWTKTEVLEFPGSVDGPWAQYVDPATVRPGPHPNPLPGGEGTGGRRQPPTANRPQGEGTGGIGTVRWPRLVPRDPDCAASLKSRTLTNLYNQRPAWLDLAHKKLDAAVLAAYGWDPGISDEELLERLLRLNLERAEKE